MFRSYSLFLMFLTGCSAGETKGDTGLPDALNDQDAGAPASDIDVDGEEADMDADADGGPPEYVDWSLIGRIDYHSTNNERVGCDTTIELSGTAYTGECEGCDYAFSIESSIAEEAGEPEDCVLSPLLSFVSDGVRENMILAHADETYIEQDEVEVLVSNSVQVGFSMYYEATETSDAIELEGPFWWQMYYDGIEKEATFSRDDDQLNWSFEFENTVATWDGFAMLDDCGEELTDRATEAFIGDIAQEETIPCDGWQADVWEVVVGEESDGFQVLVDTISAETSFDPALLVNDPTGCARLYADDGFDCTHPPPYYQCPAGTVEGGPGTYQIMVFSYGQCSTDNVEYQIEISDATIAETLTLAMDNVDRFENLVFTDQRIEVSGCATLFTNEAPEDAETCTTSVDEDVDEDVDAADTAAESIASEPTETGTPDTGESSESSDEDSASADEETEPVDGGDVE